MTESTTSRRKFLTTGAAAIAGGAAAASFPSVSVAAKPVVLKVQAAWGGGIFLEFAQDYVDRVNKMSGGSLKIDLLGVGAVVKDRRNANRGTQGCTRWCAPGNRLLVLQEPGSITVRHRSLLWLVSQ